MIQSVNPTPTDETDGLPMPRRIWAVISVGFALCMSVLDVNIINIVLPTLSHDFGTSPAVTTWIINGWQSLFLYCLFPLWGRLSVIEKYIFRGLGYSVSLHWFAPCPIHSGHWRSPAFFKDSALRLLQVWTRRSYDIFIRKASSDAEWELMPW